MNRKRHIPLSSAIDEAINFGFRNRFILQNDSIHPLEKGIDISATEFAVVETYPVVFNDKHKGYINYIVLNNGQLGFLVSETKNIIEQTELTKEGLAPIDGILENIYMLINNS